MEKSHLWEKLKNSFLFHLVLFFLCIGIGWGAVSMFLYAFSLSTEKKGIRETMVKIEAENKKLEASLLELETPEAIERRAKDRMNLKNEGEGVVIVVPDAITQDSEHEKPLFDRIREFINFDFYSP